MDINWDLHAAYTPGNYMTNVRQIIVIQTSLLQKGVEESM